MLTPSHHNNPLTALTAQTRCYQYDDACHAVENFQTFKGVLLAHEPGLGKTIIALTVMAQMQSRRVLIICPAVARLVWESEILQWVPCWKDRLVIVHPDQRPADLKQRLSAPDAIVVLSYHTLGALHDPADDIAMLDTLSFDLLVEDEAHYLKSLGALRTQRVYGKTGLASRAAKVLLLTGTPAPNGPHELYSHLSALWPELIQIKSRHGPPRTMTEAEWNERVCLFRFGKHGPTYIGIQNKGLIQRTIKPIIIRRTRREVLSELPPVMTRDIPLGLERMRTLAQLTPEARRFYDKLEQRLRLKPGINDVLAALHPAPGPDAGALATLRRQLAELKVFPAAEWAAPRLDADLRAKMVFFGWHVGALRRLHALMAQYHPVILIGETVDRDRRHAIDRFQNDPRCRVFVGQLGACGTAVTLTSGTECAFLEAAWTPGVNDQGIGRLHRIGQRDSVLASFLFVPGTIDETVMRVFRRKASGLREFIKE